MQNAMDVELYGDLFDESKSEAPTSPGSQASPDGGGVRSPGSPKRSPSFKEAVQTTVAPLSTLRQLMVQKDKKEKKDRRGRSSERAGLRGGGEAASVAALDMEALMALEVEALPPEPAPSMWREAPAV